MSQSIKAGESAVVIASAGDTIIQNGVSKDEMKAIIETLADQMPRYAAMATSIVDDRLDRFEKKIMDKFATGQSSVNAEAFADPDFQYMLRTSQHAFARSGDELTADILVDLIAQRSLQTGTRSRLVLSLNDAVEKSAYLTPNEFAELSLNYFMKSVVNNGIRNFPVLCRFLSAHTVPLLPDISPEQSSYAYLQAQSCASIEVMSYDLAEILHQTYGGLLSMGNEKERFAAVLGDDFEQRYPELIRTSIHDGAKFQVNTMNKEMLKDILPRHGLEDKMEELWGIHSQTFMSKDQIIIAAKPFFPEVDRLFALWDGTPVKTLSLTSVGTAIGFANLRRITGFEGDLSIWIT